MSRSYSVFFLGVVALLLAAAPADAQRRRDRARDDDSDGFAHRGDAALTFSFDAFSPGPYEGGVGARYWFSDRVAGSASLGFGYGNVDTGYGDQDAFTSSFSVGLERHFGHRRTVSPYVGFLANVAYTSYDQEVPIYDYPVPEPCPAEGECPIPVDYGYGTSVGTQEMAVGGALLLGAEVRIVDGVTLGLAHALGVTYARGDRDDVYYYGDDTSSPPTTCSGCEGGGDIRGGGFPPIYEPSYDRVTVGTGTTSLTLSIYF